MNDGGMAGPQLHPAHAAPLKEGQHDGGERGAPDERQVGENRYREHGDDDQEVRAGEPAAPAGPATSARLRPGGSVCAHDQKMVFACAARLLWIDLMVEAVGLAMNCWIAVSAAAAIAGSVSRSPNCDTAFCPEIICTEVFWTWL